MSNFECDFRFTEVFSADQRVERGFQACLEPSCDLLVSGYNTSLMLVGEDASHVMSSRGSGQGAVALAFNQMFIKLQEGIVYLYTVVKNLILLPIELNTALNSIVVIPLVHI